MRVTIDAPLVVSQTTSFGETWVVASGGAGASGVNDRGGITLSEGDLNPERIQIDANSTLFAGYTPNHSQGDSLSDVTGIMALIALSACSSMSAGGERTPSALWASRP